MSSNADFPLYQRPCAIHIDKNALDDDQFKLFRGETKEEAGPCQQQKPDPKETDADKLFRLLHTDKDIDEIEPDKEPPLVLLNPRIKAETAGVFDTSGNGKVTGYCPYHFEKYGQEPTYEMTMVTDQVRPLMPGQDSRKSLAAMRILRDNKVNSIKYRIFNFIKRQKQNAMFSLVKNAIDNRRYIEADEGSLPVEAPEFKTEGPVIDFMAPDDFSTKF